MKHTFFSNSENETNKVAVWLSSKIKNGDAILLNGEIGAGKTFFIKSLLNIFDVKNVSSPTFAIVNEYNGKYKFIHIDFYRIKKADELFEIGYFEYLNNLNDIILLIEWADLFLQYLPDRCIQINIDILNDDRRKIDIEFFQR
jgi:tRNA threonylcarbamoyladenosine biosynthesis protein TsaE